MKYWFKKKPEPAGNIVLFVLVFGAVGLVILGGLVRWGIGVV